jgi:hypothetical protein
MGAGKMWRTNQAGEKEFKFGLEAWTQAAQAAQACAYFLADDEDEMIADEKRSCYNCSYRRWTVQAFICTRGRSSEQR